MSEIRARVRRFLGRDALADLDTRIVDLAADLHGRVDRLEDNREAHADRLSSLDGRISDVDSRLTVTQEAILLAEASRLIPKKPVVALVEAAANYGNVTALARALHAELGAEHVAVLARDAASAEHWNSEGVRAYAWTLARGAGAAEAWQVALTAAVSVYEHHHWWRQPEHLVRRSLLEGSAKVQLWHAGSAGYGKEVALLTVAGNPGLFEFADVATTSVGFSGFVCEPLATLKRAEEFQFERQISDVNFRMVAPLQRAAANPRPTGPPRVLLAPTWPESEHGALRLADRVRAYASAAVSTPAEVVIRFHTWTPPHVREAAAGLPVLDNEIDLYDCLDTFDVVVTDFSSTAADALLLGRRVVLDHTDAAAYLAERHLRRYDDVLACCDIATSPQEAVALACDPSTDTKSGPRTALSRARLDALGAEPGQNTLAAIRDLLAARR